MSTKQRKRIALVGNPNSGKSSLFNQLTGLNQKIGNFPGVTVDKKSGISVLLNGEKVEIIDLPGTYSIYPKSNDETVVANILLNKENALFPDILVVVVDASNLKRNLLLFTQMKDLGLPVILALNMVDMADRIGVGYDLELLEKELGALVISTNARVGEGIDELKKALENQVMVSGGSFFDVTELAKDQITDYLKEHPEDTAYWALQQLTSEGKLEENDSVQAKDTTLRYGKINRLVKQVEVKKEAIGLKPYSEKIDKILTHKIWGYVIFLSVLFVIFQAIFAWASWPMDLIDIVFSELSAWLSTNLPAGIFTDLLAKGLVPGIGGVLIFIPQIAILFAFISLLEESGYMARVVFLMDKIMRKFGLNGKSVVPLISGVACAIPAIMATRTIENWKERMITIFVTPLMSCSARLPVYTILIALVIPDEYVLGVFNMQGLVLLSLYLLGFIAVLISAYILKKLMKTTERSFLIMELPTYKTPRWKNVGLTILEKVKTFSFEAGKIIIAVSIVLWVLATYGPGDNIANAEANVKATLVGTNYTEAELNDKVASYKLENSYVAKLGKAIEPAIKPLGFNWKVGIALVTSFAAREVFVGTMSTIYSIESADGDVNTIKARMGSEINPETGQLYFTLPVGLSLMVFYVFAMQCISTLAITYRETKGWKWPILQTIYMSGLAYVLSLLTFNLFS
ncbi:MAG: ferrous iron transport protein B [Cyclobacteriaceae bacterium]|nr:ferrous iron transport protein B [Cyclobacteriaceae bacterium]